MVRSPMQVDEEFIIKIKQLKKKIMKTKGEDPSLRELTKMIVKDPNFEVIENRLLNLDSMPNIDIKLKLDRRIFR